MLQEAFKSAGSSRENVRNAAKEGKVAALSAKTDAVYAARFLKEEIPASAKKLCGKRWTRVREARARHLHRGERHAGTGVFVRRAGSPRCT